jgi:uncharacterized protein
MANSSGDAATNKEIGVRFFKSLVTDPDAAGALMHEDFQYWVGGNMPVSGWHDLPGFIYTQQVLGDVVAGPPTMKLGEVVAEGDRVMIEAESEIPLSNGGLYNNYYVMALRVNDGKVIELKEFADTLHTYQAIEHDATRGPSKDRQSPLTSVTETWSPQPQGTST